MTAVSTSLSQLDAEFRLILCDLWGCVHDGIAPFEGVVELLRTWRKQGRTIVFITNAPRPAADVQAQLERLGIGTDCYDAVTSSGDAGLAHLARDGKSGPLGFIGPERDLVTLRAAGLVLGPLDEASTIVCCGFDDSHLNDLKFYKESLQAAAGRGAVMLCFNPDLYVMRGDAQELCAGSIALEYQRVGGQVMYFGKPHPPIYERAFELASHRSGQLFARREALAIGDNLATDLRGAAIFGLAFVFVSGGVEHANAEGVNDILAETTASRNTHPNFRIVKTVERLC